MRLVYFIQLLALTLAFLYGYWKYLTPWRLVISALVLQLLYGLVVFHLYYTWDVLSVFDFNRLDKETWLMDLILWLGKLFGNRPRILVADHTWWCTMFTGGFLVSLNTILLGGLFARVLHATRADYAQSNPQA
ncbi:MAG: hypothetical protein SFY70_02875 [Bacteroidia bacterium]|nr:hypothetical protein [Bacteroidia bacterium]